MAASPSYRTTKATNVRRSTAKQRRERELLMNVSVRSSQASRLRQRKIFSFLCKFLGVVGIAASLYFGVRKGVNWLLLKNPDYNVGELNVETDGVLAREVVLEAADVHKGSNIFLVNLTRAKARVEALPLVEKAQVSRQMPNRISIQINERKPVAWIAPEHGALGREQVVASSNSHLIDAHGVLLPVANAAPQDHSLPIIRNYSGGPRQDGLETEGEEIKAALDLLHAQQDSMIAARFQIQEIDLAKHFGLQVTDRNGLQVLFDLDDMDKQLKRLDAALQALDQSGQKPQSINLLVQKNIPVTFVTEPTAVAPTPAPVTTPGVAAATPSPGKPTAGKGKPASTKQERPKEKPAPKKHDEEKHHPAPAKSHHGLQPFSANP